LIKKKERKKKRRERMSILMLLWYQTCGAALSLTGFWFIGEKLAEYLFYKYEEQCLFVFIVSFLSLPVGVALGSVFYESMITGP
jgi:hypothetical protein